MASLNIVLPSGIYPIVLGNFYQHSSVRIIVGGQLLPGCKSSQWAIKNDSKLVFGESRQAIGSTPGLLTPTASLTYYAQFVPPLLAALAAVGGLSPLSQRFNAQQVLKQAGLPTATVDFIGAKIINVGQDTSERNDALVRKLDLQLLDLRIDGVSMLEDNLINLPTP